MMSSIDTTTATRMPSKVPNITTPPKAMIAHHSSMRRIWSTARNSPTLIKPAAAIRTNAPKVASGIRPMSGAKNNSVTTTTPTVTISASWDLAPAWSFTAVWDVPPPAGKAWNKPPPMLPIPKANNSWLATGS